MQPIRALDTRPNYGRRRLAAMVAVIAVVCVPVVAFVLLSGAGDDTVAVEPVTSVAPVSSESIGESSDVEPADAVPSHHGYRDDALYVAVYGATETPSLGVLGERPPRESAAFAQELAGEYGEFSDLVVPAFEIIASVASFDAGDGDYSNEAPIEQLRPWIDVADEAGLHVVLDLQSGRERFPSQIVEFEELLLEPHVSVALDPEWRVGVSEVPRGGEVGSVTHWEVNDVVVWLDALVAENDLPPKMLIVHQFQDQMISRKPEIRGTDNVQIVIHMDGFGPLRLKRETYDRVTSDLPPGAVVGWKNFYDEDEPTPTPSETMDNDPRPMFVSFQ